MKQRLAEECTGDAHKDPLPFTLKPKCAVFEVGQTLRGMWVVGGRAWYRLGEYRGGGDVDVQRRSRAVFATTCDIVDALSSCKGLLEMEPRKAWEASVLDKTGPIGLFSWEVLRRFPKEIKAWICTSDDIISTMNFKKKIFYKGFAALEKSLAEAKKNRKDWVPPADPLLDSFDYDQVSRASEERRGCNRSGSRLEGRPMPDLKGFVSGEAIARAFRERLHESSRDSGRNIENRNSNCNGGSDGGGGRGSNGDSGSSSSSSRSKSSSSSNNTSSVALPADDASIASKDFRTPALPRRHESSDVKKGSSAALTADDASHDCKDKNENRFTSSSSLRPGKHCTDNGGTMKRQINLGESAESSSSSSSTSRTASKIEKLNENQNKSQGNAAVLKSSSKPWCKENGDSFRDASSQASPAVQEVSGSAKRSNDSKRKSLSLEKPSDRSNAVAKKPRPAERPVIDHLGLALNAKPRSTSLKPDWLRKREEMRKKNQAKKDKQEREEISRADMQAKMSPKSSPKDSKDDEDDVKKAAVENKKERKTSSKNSVSWSTNLTTIYVVERWVTHASSEMSGSEGNCSDNSTDINQFSVDTVCTANDTPQAFVPQSSSSSSPFSSSVFDEMRSKVDGMRNLDAVARTTVKKTSDLYLLKSQDESACIIDGVTNQASSSDTAKKKCGEDSTKDLRAPIPKKLSPPPPPSENMPPQQLENSSNNMSEYVPPARNGASSSSSGLGSGGAHSYGGHSADGRHHHTNHANNNRQAYSSSYSAYSDQRPRYDDRGRNHNHNRCYSDQRPDNYRRRFHDQQQHSQGRGMERSRGGGHIQTDNCDRGNAFQGKGQHASSQSAAWNTHGGGQIPANNGRGRGRGRGRHATLPAWKTRRATSPHDEQTNSMPGVSSFEDHRRDADDTGKFEPCSSLEKTEVDL